MFLIGLPERREPLTLSFRHEDAINGGFVDNVATSGSEDGSVLVRRPDDAAAGSGSLALLSSIFRFLEGEAL